MQKDNIKLNKNVPQVEFQFEESTIKVLKYVDLKTKTRIISSYIGLFFKDDDLLQNYLIAENSLILEVTDLCTNVQILGDNAIELEALVSSGLWDMIYPRIANYAEVRRDIQKLIEMTRANIFSEKSVGVILDLLFEKLTEVLENISNVDFDSKNFSEVIDQLKLETAKLSEIFMPVTITKIRKKKPGTIKKSDEIIL
jgi:hypothetical protein